MAENPARFEAIQAGASVLLRLHAHAAAADAVLVVDRGHEVELVRALPEPPSSGALGFVCDVASVAPGASFWLQVDDRVLPLPHPVQRAPRVSAG